MYCLKHGQMPSGGGQPKGKELREIATDLQAIASSECRPVAPCPESPPAVAGNHVAVSGDQVVVAGDQVVVAGLPTEPPSGTVVTVLPTKSPTPTAGLPPAIGTAAAPEDLPIEDQPNEPLSKSDNEVRRSLAELDKQLIVDPANMSPAASRYIRSRPWATPEFLREARCGYMPSDAKSTLERSQSQSRKST